MGDGVDRGGDRDGRRGARVIVGPLEGGESHITAEQH